MRFDFFTIPVIGGEDAADALNRLVGSVRVLSVNRQFVADGANSCWAVCDPRRLVELKVLKQTEAQALIVVSRQRKKLNARKVSL